MKKIIFIINNLGEGGTQRVFLNLLNNLNRDKYNVILVLTKSKGDYFELLKKDIKVIELNCKRARFFPLKLYKHLKKELPDIVMSGLTDNNLIIGFTLAKLLNNVKFIARESNTLSKSCSKMKKIFIKIGYKSFSKIISQSEDMERDLKVNFKISSKKINNPIDIEKINEFLKIDIDIEFDSDYKNLLCVGKLSSQKGFDMAINAMKDIKDIKIRLFIMGIGNDQEKLKKQVEMLKLTEKVIFLGRRYNPYIYMEKADLFILSSRYEGFPNVLLEANACGTYALSNNCSGGINEIIEEGLNGSVVDFNDSKLVARKIEELVNKKHDRKKIKNYIISKYRVEKIIEQYETLFDEIIEGRN